MAIIEVVSFLKNNGQKLNGKPGNELLSKGNFDRVESIQIKNPEGDNSGLINETDSVRESAIMDRDKPIIAKAPNSYKDYGAPVNNSGYFIIPRSVSSDPRYKSARLKYKHVLHILFENVAFSPTTHAIGTEVISIAIGQYCISERNLVDLCNEGVKFKEDKVDKNIVHRAVHFWARCGIVNQQVIHDKTLLTITVPEFYERKKKTSEPGSETEVNQNRTTKEEDKEDKEDNISKRKGSFEPSPLATSLLTEFYSSLFLSIPSFPKEKAKKTKNQYEAAERLLKTYSLEIIKEVIAYAHQPSGFWIKHVHSVAYLEKKFITMHEQLKHPMNKNKVADKPSRHNNPSFAPKEQKPLAFNNKLSFKDKK